MDGMQMRIGKMCASCPFWRRSVPSNFAVFGEIARRAALALSQDMPIACRESALPDIRACVGSLIFRKNAGLVANLTVDLRADVMEALQHVDCDPAVFSSLDEYTEHHEA